MGLPSVCIEKTGKSGFGEEDQEFGFRHFKFEMHIRPLSAAVKYAPGYKNLEFREIIALGLGI